MLEGPRPCAILCFTVNPGHAWTIFLKFERSFEIYMSVLKIANEISEFPYKFPWLIDGIKQWIFLYIAKLNISRITSVSKVFWIFFSVYASFSERFPEKYPTFHSHVGHYKEKFECSFHSWKYCSRVTWIDCNVHNILRGTFLLVSCSNSFKIYCGLWTVKAKNANKNI